jgi:hypothetical protein
MAGKLFMAATRLSRPRPQGLPAADWAFRAVSCRHRSPYRCLASGCVQIQHQGAVYEPQMTESLGEVPQESAVLGNLLGVEADIVGKIEKFGEAGFGLIETAEPGQGIDQPEGTQNEGPLMPGKSVIAPVAIDQGAVTQAVDYLSLSRLAISWVCDRTVPCTETGLRD